MYRIRQGISSGNISEALEDRYPDSEGNIRDFQIRELLRNPVNLSPPMSGGQILFGNGTAEYIKDLQMYIHSMNIQSEELEYAVSRILQEQTGYLEDILATIEGGEDLIAETKIQAMENYTEAKKTSFNLAEDLAMGPGLDADPKTGTSFDYFKNARPRRGVGVTQSRLASHAVGIEDAYIESALSNRTYIFENDHPMNLVDPGSVFSQIIGLQEEAGGQLSAANKCELVIGFKLEHVQDVNEMHIEGLSVVACRLTKLEYKNLNDVWTEIPIEDTDLIGKKNFVFDVVTAKSMRITLEQTATERGSFVFGKDPINEILESHEFQYLLQEDTLEFQGSIYDFSLKSVSFGLSAYYADSYYQGAPIDISNAYGTSVLDRFSGAGYIERWLYVNLESDESVAFDGMVPLPDYDYLQKEVLFPEDGICKVKLYPQFDNVIQNVIKVVSLKTDIITGTTSVTTEEPHGLASTDEVKFIGHDSLPDTYVVAITSSTEFSISVPSIFFDEEGFSPYLYAYQVNGPAIPRPFDVYEDGVLLTIGTDYEYSIDSSDTWSSSYSYERSDYNSVRIAGQFMIKLTNADHQSRYHIQYTYHPRQQLDSSGAIMLRNRVVEFPENTSGVARPVFIFRSSSTNIYNTLILKSYWTKTKARE